MAETYTWRNAVVISRTVLLQYAVLMPRLHWSDRCVIINAIIYWPESETMQFSYLLYHTASAPPASMKDEADHACHEY